ncbi:MAG: xanthine dehydrogenase family protein molybdopterin-binding subunit [Acidimicrobiia bacterium]
MTTEPQIPSFLGAAVQRREDPALIRGTARFVDDISPSGTLHLALVRSPFPHARITSIDVEAARDVPGIRAIITPEDVADVRMPPTPDPERNVPRRFPLVQDKALMPGDPVVAVVAETAAAARDAADLVFVDYEMLDVVGDVEEAIEAAPIHDGFESNIAYDRSRGDRSEFDALTGSVRLSGVVEHPRVVPAPMEPRAILAEWKEDGLTVHLSSQAPQLMQQEFANSFDLPQSAVRVITPFVGGGFGCKFDLAEEEYLTVIAARNTGQPVKWIETRREHLLTIGHGRAQRHKWEAVADDDGKLQGLWVDTFVDLGCRHRYLSNITITTRMGTGNYDIGVYGWTQKGVWTNRASRGIYRGAGRPEATLTVERVIDAIATATGIDPAEVRRRNFIRPDQFPYRTRAGYTYDSGDYEKALDKLLEFVDYPGLRAEQARARSEGRLVGLGFGSYVEVCGFEDWGAARIQVHADGSVSVYVETLDQGQGHRTSFAQLVADRLGIPIEQVKIEQGDSATSPYGWGTSGSRSLAQGGSASYAAAEKVAEKAKKIAAHLLEASPEDIELGDSRATVVGTEVSVGWTEIASAALSGNVPEGVTPGLDEEIHLKSGGLNFPYGVHLAQVEIDRDTGAPTLQRMWAVDDAGNIVNPMLAEGQRHGGLAQGVGQALWEEARYDADGNLVTSSFIDYLIPSSVTLPLFELESTVTPTPTNPLGAKGIGEAGAIGSTPAVLNAVCDALQTDDIQIPLTPEKIWSRIRS